MRKIVNDNYESIICKSREGSTEVCLSLTLNKIKVIPRYGEGREREREREREKRGGGGANFNRLVFIFFSSSTHSLFQVSQPLVGLFQISERKIWTIFYTQIGMHQS